jgi:hypothetical protein
VAGFEAPTDLQNNRGLIEDPAAFAREANAASSWLFLCGEEFAEMDAGMSTPTSSRGPPVRQHRV